VIGPLRTLRAGWTQFWFTPRPTSTLAVFRIVFGLVAIGWTASLAPNLFTFFGPDGVLPHHRNGPGVWGLLELSNQPLVLVGLFTVVLLAALALALGWRSRLAAVVVFVGILSFERRNPMIINSGDGLIRNLALYLALSPCGAALSLDRLRTHPERFWEFPAKAPWALRLMQIQLSVLYLSTVWHKSQGDKWRTGTAVSYAQRMADIHRFSLPRLVTDSVPISEVLTFGTLGLETALAILVWNRAARPWVLALGVSLHLGIDYSIIVGFFSYAMFTAYLAFIPPETASRWILRVRDRLPPLITRRQPRPSPASEPRIVSAA
jgi:hypothetical protein